MQILTAAVLIAFLSGTTWAQIDTQADEPQAVSQTTPATNPAGGAPPATPPQGQPTYTVYSRAYEVRNDIHKYASWATLPLFATEFALGQSLYDTPGSSGSKRGAHAAVGMGLVGLFAVNTATGVWNLWVGRHDPKGRKLRIVHSALMTAAQAGLIVTAANGPSRHSPNFNADKGGHRKAAVVSIGLGTTGYLLMLFRKH